MKRSSSNETDIPINAGLELRIQMQSVSSSPGWKVSYIQTPMNIQVSPDSRPQISHIPCSIPTSVYFFNAAS